MVVDVSDSPDDSGDLAPAEGDVCMALNLPFPPAPASADSLMRSMTPNRRLCGLELEPVPVVGRCCSDSSKGEPDGYPVAVRSRLKEECMEGVDPAVAVEGMGPVGGGGSA